MNDCRVMLLEWLIAVEIVVTIQAAELPNIVFILADDLGWNDVSFHGSDQIPTPNIDALAYDGIILNNYYVLQVCSPTRSALLTGKHPVHLGMQSSQTGQRPYGLGLDEKLLPEFLKELGYTRHMIGKWHLGHFQESYTPTHRGFDSFYGFFDGGIDYFQHTYWAHRRDTLTRGKDFWRNDRVERLSTGLYSTELFTAEAEQLIERHNKSQPLFIYMAHQAVHVGSPEDRLQAPCYVYNRFENIQDDDRKKVAAMISSLDDSVGNVTKALAHAGMLDNTIIIFTSDNGGPRNRYSNWPLRGAKRELFEGGTRVPAFLWSPLLKESGYVSNHMMHAVDLLPTILLGVGYSFDNQEKDKLDGFDLWDTLSLNLPDSPRTEILYNINDDKAALRVNNLKLIWGSMRGTWNIGNFSPLDKPAPPQLFHTDIPDILVKQLGRQIHSSPQPIVINCGLLNASSVCEPEIAPCLFDLSNDPCEYNNLADERPEDVRNMLSYLEDYNRTVVPELNEAEDPNSFPPLHNWAWGPWK